jgi:hypothetical protein
MFWRLDSVSGFRQNLLSLAQSLKLVTRSKIRAVRWVVKQLAVEMLQQCSSVSSCIWTCLVMEEHCTGCQHSTPFVLNGHMQFFLVILISDVIMVSCCMNGTLFLSQKTGAISFLAGRQHLFKLFQLVW